MKRILFAVGALALLLTGCHPWGGPFGPPSFKNISEHVVKHIHNELSLTKEQDQKLGVVIDTIRAEWGKMTKDQGEKSASWDALVSAPKLDQVQLRSMLDAHHTAAEADRAALLDKLVPQIADFLDSLTPAQKTKLVEMHTKLADRMKSALKD